MLQVVTPCSLVAKYQRFVETCCLYLQSLLREVTVALWIEVTSSGEGEGDILGSLLYLQQHVPGPYPEPDESGTYSCTPFS